MFFKLFKYLLSKIKSSKPQTNKIKWNCTDTEKEKEAVIDFLRLTAQGRTILARAMSKATIQQRWASKKVFVGKT